MSDQKHFIKSIGKQLRLSDMNEIKYLLKDSISGKLYYCIFPFYIFQLSELIRGCTGSRYEK